MSGGLPLAAVGTSDAVTVNIASYFTGGVQPYEFAPVGAGVFVNNNVDAEAAEEVTDAKLDKTSGDLTFKLTAPANGVDSNLFLAEAYTEGYKIAVKATDANGVSVTNDVIIALNRAPRLFGADTNPADTVVDESVDTPLLLGTQAADRGTALAADVGVHAACMKINECLLAVFDDDDKITVTVAGMTVGGKADNTKVSAVENDKGVTLMGMSSTWVAADNTVTPQVIAGHRSVRVNLVATDSKGLMTKAAVMVDVDAAPSLSTIGMAIHGSTVEVKGTYKPSDNINTLFKDDLADSRTIDVTGTPAEPGIATWDNADDEVTGVAISQSTTITLKATEMGNDNLGQTATIEFTVTVASLPTS
jgi:hypothetical protein